MNKTPAIIIDDDLYIREQLSGLIGKFFPEIELLTTAANGHEGLFAIRKFSPALIFLDIEMPDMSGFTMLEQLPEINFEIIFITSFNQYAIKAIRFSALDYLLKPIQPEELKIAIDRFKSKKHHDSRDRLLNYVNNTRLQDKNDFKLALSTTQGTLFLTLDEISFCEAQINYTLFHLQKARKIISSKTLKEYDELLADHNFIRVHKSYLVNRKHVRSITKEHKLLLNDGHVVEISKRKFPDVKALLRIA